MLFPSRHRYHPRQQQDHEHRRRDAALRAEVADLASRVSELEKELRVQFKRMADMQAQLDEALKLIRCGLGRS